MGVSVEPISGTVELGEGRLPLQRTFPGIAVQHDVLNDHDLGRRSPAHGGRQAAKRHQIEALTAHASR